MLHLVSRIIKPVGVTASLIIQGELNKNKPTQTIEVYITWFSLARRWGFKVLLFLYLFLLWSKSFNSFWTAITAQAAPKSYSDNDL